MREIIIMQIVGLRITFRNVIVRNEKREENKIIWGREVDGKTS
jgi:hypothetical protein